MESNQFLRNGIILVWACWYTLAACSNSFDLLKAYHYVPISFRFVSNNYLELTNVMQHLYFSSLSVTLFFICIIFLDFLIALFFWLGFIETITSNGQRFYYTHWALTLGTLLWGTFVVMEEAFIAYQFESLHLLLMCSQLICLLALKLMPIARPSQIKPVL